jgi:hypothetical protein
MIFASIGVDFFGDDKKEVDLIISMLGIAIRESNAKILKKNPSQNQLILSRPFWPAMNEENAPKITP